MSEARAIAVDLASLKREDGSLRKILSWGDPVSVLEVEADRLKVEILDYRDEDDGSVVPTTSIGFLERFLGSGKAKQEVALPVEQVKVLKVDFVDVQQGDGALIETPAGKTITLDGGDNQLFARYLAARFPGTSDKARKEIEAMVVTHGDADHFAGLVEIHDSEANEEQRKRLFAHPRRVYHNGLVKRPSSVPEAEMLGAAEKVGKATIITGLETDLTAVPDKQMNTYFKRWKKALKAWREQGGEIVFRRLARGDDDAFDFLSDEDIKVEVLGPIPVTRKGVKGLPFLGAPPKGPEAAPQDASDEEFKGEDVSHTINGHSIVLRLAFKNWRMVFAGDLNTQAEQKLTADHKAGRLDLGAEIFKVPHHGSAEFSGPFLEAVKPLVSVVSSGDESARKEYIHPRATLMNALGRNSRGDSSVVFVTELVAFFEAVGWVRPDAKKGVESKPPTKREEDFFAFRRDAFGIVSVRTDGERLLVYTNSGLTRLKEAYAYTASTPGEATPVAVRKA
jgi:ribonuclease BN (tRNA processing enzyme)